MPYLTTNHRFTIDEKHPSDVFDEMENFFSLFTTAIDDLQQVSVQLSVPPSFDINDNKKIAESYRQFIKAIRYIVPDINVLPVKTRTTNAQTDEEGNTDIDDPQDDNSLNLLIQRFEGVSEEENESKGSSFLGRLIPRFASYKSDTGLYPERKTPVETIAVPSPLPPVTPVPVAVPTPAPQPIPQPVLRQTPVPTHSYQPTIVPSVPQPIPVVPPLQSQPVSNPPQNPQTIQQPTPIASQSVALQRLPNIAKSAKPYQDILTQAIVNEVKKQAALLGNQPINQITLKSSDSLTTAMIEQLFNSFNNAHDKSQSPHDAIDLVSYGYEVLKPQLAKIGVKLADDAQFGLKTTAKSTPADITRLQSGAVFANEINLKIKLLTNQANSQTATQNPQGNSPQASQPSGNTASYATINNPNANQNSQNIALMLKISDQLGERQQKVSRFPLEFATREATTANAIRLFSTNHQLQSEIYFSIVELDGNVLLDNLDPNVKVLRQGQSLNAQALLMPNDVLTIDCHGIVGTVTLGLV